MQEYAFLLEIQKYEALLDTSGGDEVLSKLAWMAGNGILSFGLVIVSFLVGAIAITTVPSISTWIISTSGVTSASATMGRTGSTLSRTASRMSVRGILGK
jgi:hypothetical protein